MRRNSIRGKRGVAATVLAATLALLLLAGCKTEGDDQPPAAETVTVTVTFNANAPAGESVSGEMKAQTVTKGEKLTKNSYICGGGV